MSTSAPNSLFELDCELDLLLEEIQTQAEVNGDDNVPLSLIERFQEFCHAYNQKIDRIGRFILSLDARAAHCRQEAVRLSNRARIAENKSDRTKKMVLYFLSSRGLKKVEGVETTLRMQKNSQDSVMVKDDALVPLEYREIEAKIPGPFWQQIRARLLDPEKNVLNSYIRQSLPSPSAIKAAAAMNEKIPGAGVQRGYHLRVE